MPRPERGKSRTAPPPDEYAGEMDNNNDDLFLYDEEDDFEPEHVEDIDGDLEAYERHLEHRCDCLFCEFCLLEAY